MTEETKSALINLFMVFMFSVYMWSSLLRDDLAEARYLRTVAWMFCASWIVILEIQRRAK